MIDQITDQQRNNIRFQLQAYVFSIIIKSGFDMDLNKIQILDSKDGKFGDFAVNSAMSLAGQLGKSPKEIAQTIVDEIDNDENKPDFIKKVEVAGPGFINFTLSDDYFKDVVKEIVDQGDDYGRMEVGKGKKVMIEYGQPNTHKAFHIGHVKSGISGIFMINLFEAFGYSVVKANFYGDVGMHVAKCLWGVKSLGIPEGMVTETPDNKIAFIQDAYVKGANAFKDDKVAEQEIRQINMDVYSRDNEETNKLYDMTRRWSRDHMEDVFDLLNIRYDIEFPESGLFKLAKELVQKNLGVNLVEDGGAVIFEGEKYGLHNRVFLTSEGNATYESKDLALACTKFNKYPDMIHSYVFTATEQNDYFNVVFKAISEIFPEIGPRYEHIGFGLLLVRGKKESSRTGISLSGKEFVHMMIDLEEEILSTRDDFTHEKKIDLAKEIGISALRYMILKHPFHADISFDPSEALSVDGNSAPYIMYAYTRANSILKSSEAQMKKLLSIQDLELNYKENEEIELLKHLSKYEDVLVNSFNKLTPHLLALYLFELSQLFNKFYKAYSVVNAEESLKDSRLILVAATAQILKNGLKVLGIGVLGRM